MLDDRPDLLSPTCAKDLREFSESHPDLLFSVVQKIAAGLPQSKAVAWVRSHIDKKPLTELRREFLSPRGNRVAVVSASDKKVSVSFDDKTTADQVLIAIQDLVNKIASEQP